MTIIYFILVLGITVLVHEFGHYLFANNYIKKWWEIKEGFIATENFHQKTQKFSVESMKID